MLRPSDVTDSNRKLYTHIPSVFPFNGHAIFFFPAGSSKLTSPRSLCSLRIFDTKAVLLKGYRGVSVIELPYENVSDKSLAIFRAALSLFMIQLGNLAVESSCTANHASKTRVYTLPPPGGGYSLQWPILGGSARKGCLFQASGI